MSPVNREYRVLNKFIEHMKAKIQGTDAKYRTARLKGLSSAKKVIAFYKKHNRWPSCLAKGETERKLGRRFENFMSKQSPQYSKDFRRLAMALGRKTNHKRKHDVQGFKKEILAFVEKHGRVPTTKSGERIEGESVLRNKLDYYTKKCNDMTLLGQVYAIDKCHKSGIPMRFRAVINEALQDAEKPLIRTVS